MRILSSFVAVAALLVACSGAGVEPSIRTQSHTVLSEPPDLVHFGRLSSIEGHSWTYFVDKESTQMSLTPSNGDDDELTLALPGAKVLGAWVLYVSDTEYLLVSTVDVSGIFSFYRYHDTSGDGAPDLSTQTLLVSSGSTEVYVTTALRFSGARLL